MKFQKGDIIRNKRLISHSNLGRVNWADDIQFGYTLLKKGRGGNVEQQNNPDFELVERKNIAQ